MPFPLRQAEGEQIGHHVVQRLVQREISHLQVRFLEHLHQSPINQYLTLCGAAALHGAYIHQRWSAVLDFEAPYAVVLRFAELARSAGLLLEKGLHANQFVYSDRGRVFSEMQLSLQIYVKHQMILMPTEQTFLAPPDAAPVRVLPLEELTAAKLAMLFKTPRPVDFVDVWFTLGSDSGLLARVLSVLAHPQWGRNGFTLPAPLEFTLALRQFQRLRPSWSQSLASVVSPVPSWERVHDDLQTWLQRLPG